MGARLNDTEVRPTRPARLGLTDWLLRGLIAVNVALCGLTFIPAFSGIGQRSGLADRWWGRFRVAGWRADVVWMCGSTVIVFLGALGETDDPDPRRTTVVFCRAWLLCFVVYLGYVVIHMFG